MELDLDPSSPTPLYQQIVDQVRRLVGIGALRPGDRLPGFFRIAYCVEDWVIDGALPGFKRLADKYFR